MFYNPPDSSNLITYDLSFPGRGRWMEIVEALDSIIFGVSNKKAKQEGRGHSRTERYMSR